MASKMIRPELLSPAGDFERLQFALHFGADAVYLGGELFSMRSAPENFSPARLKEAVQLAHSQGVKVYLTCNTVPKNDELKRLPEFIEAAVQAEVDAFIVTDMGVMAELRHRAPHIDIHVSTQAGIVNYLAANAFYELGAKRVVLARELSLTEIREIRERTPPELELEAFVHGAMCVSFSGRCLLSAYLTGRDSNRGDCAQPCRWKYSLMEEKRPGQYFPIDEEDNGTFILNSYDMSMLEHIPELIDAGVTSFKLEGRAKSAYYAAVVTNMYRCAIDEYLRNPHENFRPSDWILTEQEMVSHRKYGTGFYFGEPTQNYESGGYERSWSVVAVVERSQDGRVYAVQRNRIFDGDELNVLIAGREPFTVTASELRNAEGEMIPDTRHPMMQFSFSCDRDIPSGAILRIDNHLMKGR